MPTATDQTIQTASATSAKLLPTSRDAPEQQRAVLAILREKAPQRRLGWHEAEQVAEWQAKALLQLGEIGDGPVPSALISSLPRFSVQIDAELPVSGCLQWRSGRWLILLKQGEPPTRQRFTLAHEFKHAIDHRYRAVMYQDRPGVTAYAQAEHAADYFAACLLMPRTLVKREWYRGKQDVTALAHTFQVSGSAMSRRLASLGLLARAEGTSSAWNQGATR